MYIQEKYYATNLSAYHSLRDYMMLNVYSNQFFIDKIVELIRNRIDCISITYDANRYAICINIKKTTMRRAKGYEASSMYYYGIMNSVFKDFFTMHPDIVNNAIKHSGNAVADMHYENLCQVYCIGDKSVEIRL